jgi:hypothetical protein
MEEVADILDEAGDPGACEVRPYTGPLALEFKPSADFELDFSMAGGDTAYDMRLALLNAAYPALRKTLTHNEEPSTEEWLAAVEIERKRKLRPSTKWAESVRRWWEEMAGGEADKTAALREMMDVTIPGEPKPETPEQRRLFEEAQRRMMEGVAKILGEPSPRPDPPKKAR